MSMGASKRLSNIYLHIPFCNLKCNYCDFPVHALGLQTPKDQKNTMIDTYLDYLEKEMDRTLEKIDTQRISEQLDTVYFGGGTPSLMSTQQLERVLNKIRKISNINQNTEVTVEMDPGTFDRVKLREYRDLGVNRVSMGVQTFNKGEFKKLGRGHDYKQIMIALDEIVASGFDLNQVSIDLMMGIPYQTLVTYRSNLEKALQMGFGHLSFYILTLEQGTPFHKLYNYDFSPLPHQDLVADMYQLTHDLLTASSFDHYEISNYGKPNSHSRHNSMYWLGDREYLSFGCGAANFLDGVRFARPKTLKGYYRYVDEIGLLDKVIKIQKGILRDQKNLSRSLMQNLIRSVLGRSTLVDLIMKSQLQVKERVFLLAITQSAILWVL
ncbi:hypothetical protein FGO68_gene6537 [Halteria grandinella]|uniref:Radical S-adenosyl methionine domain-containing protein 1, mitochondrial n=1 Tax=Halteria grandinella TaxID=5974 RepID=A0A8J8NMH7_HALGN|nr:hypothetical protein FGO68_gene6537 [Halteria grandinella]